MNKEFRAIIAEDDRTPGNLPDVKTLGMDLGSLPLRVLAAAVQIDENGKRFEIATQLGNHTDLLTARAETVPIRRLNGP
jgi:hypothetical protein